MRRLALSLLLPFLLTSPLAAQTPLSDAQLRQQVEYAIARVENLQEEGDSVIARLTRIRTELVRRAAVVVQPAPAPTPAPGPAPAPTPTPAPSTFGPNAPAGLTTIADCDFATNWTGGDGTLACATGSLVIEDWDRGGRPNDQCRTIADPTASDGRSWESRFDDGAGGSGPCQIERSLGSPRDTVYVALRVKYSAGWQENTNDQKVLYVDTDAAPGDGMLAYRYRAEAVHYVTSATGCEALEANRASVGVKSPPESAPCQGQRAAYLTAGTWDTYEFLWICRTGTIRWWKNGQLQGDHTGRQIGCVSNLRFPDTWGGGGTLTQEQSRFYDRILVRASAN